MSKQQIIDEIRQHNRTANQEFLIRFDERALHNYLHRLTRVNGRRGRESRWVRGGDSPAVATMAMA